MNPLGEGLRELVEGLLVQDGHEGLVGKKLANAGDHELEHRLGLSGLANQDSLSGRLLLVDPEDGFAVESIDLTEKGIVADYFAGLKRAGRHVGRAASETWQSSKSAVQGAAGKRKAKGDDDS